ncbi:TPR-like protein [Abortiporus biennis]|nr:TPR-like protein [Abortiporus biennis]
MELNSSLQKLGAYQPRKSGKSAETLDHGIALLRTKAYLRQGSEGWEELEKVTLAALDQGNIEVADQCLQIISDKFPDSPRVDCLTGIRLEVTESPEVALKFYDELLEAEPSKAAIWRRKSSVLRRMGKIDQAVTELSTMLDTYYTDVEGWLELADIYASCRRYTHALQSLSHALLLAPQNPFHFLQFADTAYLASDIPLSLKMYLQVVDMTDDDDDDVAPIDQIPTGITLRAWFGVKLCTKRLLTESKSQHASASHTPAPDPDTLNKLDELSGERLKTAHLNSSPLKEEKEFIEALSSMIH